MIELIFVIVIIGILAAVAIPKLAGVQGQAQAAKISSYAGTLQRTTIPPYWSESIMSGNGGDISGNAADGVAYAKKIADDLDWPTDFGTAAPLFGSKLLDANSTAIKDGTAPGVNGTLAKATINGITYTLACTNGTKSKAPACDVWDGAKWILQANR
jgi:type II secretory pathway pseudopilin PulG